MLTKARSPCAYMCVNPREAFTTCVRARVGGRPSKEYVNTELHGTVDEEEEMQELSSAASLLLSPSSCTDEDEDDEDRSELL